MQEHINTFEISASARRRARRQIRNGFLCEHFRGTCHKVRGRDHAEPARYRCFDPEVRTKKCQPLAVSIPPPKENKSRCKP